MNKKKLLLTCFNKIEEALLCVLFSSMTIICFIQVLCRYVFHSSLVWSEEFLRACFVWSSCVGISCAFKYGGHLGVDFFLNLMPKKPRKTAALIAMTISLLFCALMMKLGWDYMIMQFYSKRMTNALGIPSAYISFAIPFGCALACVRIIQFMLKELRNNKQIDESHISPEEWSN